MASKIKDRKRTPVSHKVIEKRRRDRINRCLSELGRTVPMALAKQSSGKLEKAEILEMTVQYLRALHSADFPRGREKGELLSEFANYYHYGYHECMKNLVHYLTAVERLDTKDTEYARVLAFLQSKVATEPVFAPLASASASPEPADFACQPSRASPDFPSPNPAEHAHAHPHAHPSGHFPWAGATRSPHAISAFPPQHAHYLPQHAQGLEQSHQHQHHHHLHHHHRHHYVSFLGLHAPHTAAAL